MDVKNYRCDSKRDLNCYGYKPAYQEVRNVDVHLPYHNVIYLTKNLIQILKYKYILCKSKSWHKNCIERKARNTPAYVFTNLTSCSHGLFDDF